MTPFEEIKRLYYKTTRTTVQRDFERAIDLLKAMETDEERERASVYMEGLAEMRKEWARASTAAAPRRRRG